MAETLITPVKIRNLTNGINSTQVATAPLSDGIHYATGQCGNTSGIQIRKLSDNTLVQTLNGYDIRGLSVKKSDDKLYIKDYFNASFTVWDQSSNTYTTQSAQYGQGSSQYPHKVDPVNGDTWRTTTTLGSNGSTLYRNVNNTSTEQTINLPHSLSGGFAISESYIFRLTGSTLYVYNKSDGSLVQTYTLADSFIGGYADYWIDCNTGTLVFPVSQSSVAVYQVFTLNTAPTATITSPAAAAKFDPRLPLQVGWSYSDTEGSPQSQSQVSWRIAGGSWNDFTAVAGTGTTYTIPAHIIPDESDIEVRVRVHDGTVWGNWSASRALRADSWTYLAEIIGAANSATIDTTGWTQGTYEIGVKTADASAYGPYGLDTTSAVIQQAANLAAVPAAITLSTTAPTTGVGKSVYHNLHAAILDAVNLSPSPDAKNINYWTNLGSAAHTRSYDPAFGHKSNNSLKTTMNANGALGAKANTYDQLAVGDVIRWSIWVYGTRAATWRPYWERLGGTYKGGSGGSDVAVPANTWAKITGTKTITADDAWQPGITAYHGWGAYVPGGTWQTGDFFWVDEVTVVKNKDALPAYFDGDSFGDSRYFYRWTGTPHASTSEKLDTQVARETSLAAPAPTVTAENVVWNNAAAEPVVNLFPNPSIENQIWHIGGGNVNVERSTTWAASGSSSVKLTSQGVTADTYAYLSQDVGSMALGMKAGRTYRVSAICHVPVALTGSVVAGRYQRIVCFYADDTGYHEVISELGALVGTSKHTVDFAIPANATQAFIRLYNGSPTAGEAVFWDDISVVDVTDGVPGGTSSVDGSITDGNINLALGKSVTVVDAAGNPVAGSNLANITNGRVDNSSDYGNPNGPGGLLHAAVVDLGSVQTIDEVKVWHWHWDGRTYHKTKTQVSRDGVTWITVFDSRTEGEYQELSSGRMYKFAPTDVRYIRDWIHGNTTNGGNHWTEIQAYHRSANTYKYSWNGTPHDSTSTRKKTLANNLYAPHPHVGASYALYEDSTPLSYILLPTGPPITIYWNGLFAVPAGIILEAVVPDTTVYVMPIAPTYTIKEYQAKFVEGFTRITRRIEILNSDGETLWDDQAGNMSRLITGSVSVDYTRDERRSIDVELANFDNALIHKPGKFWYDKVIRGYRGIEFYDESGRRTYEVPVGTFLIDRVAEARFPKTVKVTGRDFTKRCLLSKFTNATGFEAAEAVEDVIAALAANAGVNNRIFPTTGKTLGTDIVFERGTTRWEAMKQIATAHGYELFFDAQGYLVMRQFLDPTLSPVSHEFKTGLPDGNLITWERAANDTRIFNHISVIGAEAGADTIPVWADAYNTNPLSPTNIDNLGDRVDTYESSLVTTFAQAQELAETFLKISALEEYEINMSSLVFPWLEAGEIVRFLAPDHNPDEPDRFLLTSFTVPLGLGPMEAIGRRVTIVS